MPCPESLPFLKELCWNIADPSLLSESEMLGIYERHWHYRRGVVLTQTEQHWIQYLIATYGAVIESHEV
uniref:Uncharacterized protein n=1 Tax=Cyanothece sp. (strain PCC 7425 / ATCC 29141) TaxID=395961 RepID=B8HZM8_CYAP4